MKALILINGYFENPNNDYKAERLCQEFAPYGVTLEIRDALSLLPFTDGNDLHLKDISDYSFCINLDKDQYLARAVSKIMPMFNSYESLVLSDDKMASLLALKESGVSAPLSVSAPLCYIDNPAPYKIKNFLDQVETELGYPLVFKECHGSLGRQVRLIHNRQELEQIYQEFYKVPHLYEKFLSKHQGHDYRVMIIGQKPVAVMERINEHDFRSNIALGGKGYDVTSTVGHEFTELALNATKALKLDYAGVDVAIGDDEKPYFLEANGNAFFTEIEKITHVNVTQKLVEYIVNKLDIK
ncbi:MAG: ATP-grasp domain-containing protein [Bacilli bacterium]